MMTLPASLSAWGSSDFSSVLKSEIEALGSDGLSLVRCATVSGHFADEISVMILRMHDTEDVIEVKIGVLYTEIEPAYCCPMMPMEHSSMCEMKITIDKSTAKTVFDLINE